MKTILAIHSSLTVATAFAQAPMTNAVVRTVDEPAAKITLKHEEIKNLGMMPMTIGVRRQGQNLISRSFQ